MNHITIMQKRIAMYQSIRLFFAQHKATEVETPILSPYGSTDLHIDSFITHLDEKPLYLHTSPEFYMKRLLADGVGDCFQITKVFRHEMPSKRHRPEFSLLEWYRLGFTMFDLMDELAELVKTLFPQWQEMPVEIVTYSQVFKPFGINPHKDSLERIKSTIIKLSGYEPQLDDVRDEWLDFLLVTKIEPQLGKNKLTFLTHYPASMAALSKTMNDSEGNVVAARFELYYQGIELANGFHELTDAKEQKSRFEADNIARKESGKPTVPYDKELIDALAKGLPDCAGVALGLDRLLMLGLDENNIESVMGLSM